MENYLSTVFDVFFNSRETLSISTDQLLLLSKLNKDYYTLAFEIYVKLKENNENLTILRDAIKKFINSKINYSYYGHLNLTYPLIEFGYIRNYLNEIEGLSVAIICQREENKRFDSSRVTKEIIINFFEEFKSLFKLANCNHIRLKYKDFELKKNIGDITEEDFDFIKSMD